MTLGWAPEVMTRCSEVDLQRLLDAVRDEAHAGYQVVVLPHWGVPGSTEILDYQIELARAVIGEGAAAVIGTHAHVVQGRDVVGSAPVLYGIGHALFDLPDLFDRWPSFEKYTVVPRLIFGTLGLIDVEVRSFIMEMSDGGIATLSPDADNTAALLMGSRSPQSP